MAARNEWEEALGDPKPGLASGVNVRQAKKVADLEALRTVHAAYIRRLQVELHRCLIASERARDFYYKRRDYWSGKKGFEGVELDLELKADWDAQKAISDNQLYDRWATKYAAVISAELAMFEHDLHLKEY